jgi:hypothetical protein
MKKGSLDDVLKAGEEALRGLEGYLRSLPEVIRAQDVLRAVSDPDWLSEQNVLRRARERKRIALLRTKARALDPAAYKKAEREFSGKAPQNRARAGRG